MNPNHLTSAMIDKIVERRIEEMAESPDTAIRQLLNYSSHFSSSRFQAPVFSILQHLLANEDSQYHIMLQNLLQNVSHSAIKNLGINLGYNSWTKGAQTVRATAQKAGYCIPWIIIFHWNPAKSTIVNLKNMARFIRDGNKIGIYAFCIRARAGAAVQRSGCRSRSGVGRRLCAGGERAAGGRGDSRLCRDPQN